MKHSYLKKVAAFIRNQFNHKKYLPVIFCMAAMVMVGAIAIFSGGLFASMGEASTDSSQESAEMMRITENMQTGKDSQYGGSISFTVDSFSDFVFVKGGKTIASDHVSEILKSACLRGDGIENNELVLGKECAYEFIPVLGKESWEIQLPDTVSWTSSTKTITTQITEVNAEGKSQIKEVTVGTIIVGQDGKVTYTPNQDCPDSAYNNEDVQNFSMSVLFNVSSTKRGGIEFPGVGTVNFQSRDLAPFLKEAKLTQDGREIGDNDTVVVGEHYNYHVSFGEKGSELLDQFSTPMHFQLPQNVTCDEIKDQPIYDKEYDPNKPVGWYSVDENGLVTFEFDEEYLASKTNVSMDLDFDLTVADKGDGSGTTFPWKDGQTKTFKTDSVPDATLKKTKGEYHPADPQGPCIDYTVELEITKGMVKNPEIKDTMGNGLSYRKGSGKVVVLDKDGKDITSQYMPNPPSLVETENGWKVENMPESLSKGEKVVVTYQSNVDFDSIGGNADKGNYSFTVENTATFTGDAPVDGEEPIEREANVNETLTDKRTEKTGSYDKEKDRIDWEIVVGSGSTDVRGAVVKDTLSGKHWIDKNMPLELKWKDETGETIHTFTIQWDDPNLKYTQDEAGHITEFNYAIPGPDAKEGENPFWQFTDDTGEVRTWQKGDRLKLEYYTQYDPTTTDHTYSNTAIVEVDEQYTFKGEDNVGIGAGTINKSGTESADGKYMEYSVTLSIPSAAELLELMGASDRDPDRPSFYIEDQLEFPSVKVYDKDNNSTNVRYFVANYPEDVTITATLDNGEVIPFIKDGSGDHSFKVAKDGIDYHTDGEDKEKSWREFQIWFNIHYGGGSTIDHNDSIWILDRPCTLTITYKVSTDSKVYLEGADINADSGLTVRDLLDQGWRLDNEVKGRGENKGANDFGATHKYTITRPEFGVNKAAKILEADPEHPFDNEIEYRVEFNAFTTNIETGEFEKVTINPRTFFLEDTFDSRLEYVPGSMEVHVYSPERRLRVQYGLVKDEGLTIGSTDDGKTKLTVGAMSFNRQVWVDEWNKDYDTLKYYMAHDKGEGALRDNDAIYIFVYRLRVKDEYNDGSQMHFDNEAIVHYGDKSNKDNAGVDFTPDVLVKNGEHAYDDTGADIVQYTVEVNPGGIDMVTTEREDLNPDRYTLTDHMDEILSLMSDSIEVYRIEKDGTETPLEATNDQALVRPKNNYFVFQEAENNTFKLILPDEQHIRIKYSASVNADKDSTVDVTNTIEMEGGMSISDTSKAEFKVDGNGASIHGDNGMRLFKQDAFTGNYIGGATFELYSTKENGSINANIDGTPYSFEKYDTLKPDALKGASIGPQERNEGKYYLLLETQAPAGYQLNEEPVIIVFGEPKDEDPETVNVSYNGKEYPGLKVHYITSGNNVVVFEDKPELYQLPETGGHSYVCLYLLGIAFALLGSALLLNKRRTFAKRG